MRKLVRTIGILLLVATPLAADAGEQRQGGPYGDRFSLGSPLVINDDEIVRDAVVIFGALEVEGEVKGNAVIIGSAEIDGIVRGNVTVVGGSVSVGKDSDVYGDVYAIGGRVHDPEGRIRGRVEEKLLAPLGDLFSGWGGDEDAWDPPWLDLAHLVRNTVLLTILVFLVLATARRKVTNIARHARHEPWKAGFVGLVVEILTLSVLVVVSGVLAISIVGIPVLLLMLPLVLLSFAGLLCMGFAGVALALGNRFGLDTPKAYERRLSPYFAVLLGVGVIQSWQIFGESLTLLDGCVRYLAYLLVAGGFLLKYFAWTIGLGALVLERFSPLAPSALRAPMALPDLETHEEV
jgi:hypothetical protein